MVKGGQHRCHDQTYGCLHAILQRAYEDELIPANPCRIKGAGRPSKRRKPKPLAPAQVIAIADAMHHQDWAIGILLGAWCGIRSGEMRELRRKDIDVDAGVIHVTRGV